MFLIGAERLRIKAPRLIQCVIVSILFNSFLNILLLRTMTTWGVDGWHGWWRESQEEERTVEIPSGPPLVFTCADCDCDCGADEECQFCYDRGDGCDGLL